MSANENGSGKWQLAFWIITVVSGAWLLTLTGNVIANDRLRVDGDKEISFILNNNVAAIRESQSLMAQDIRELKTLVKMTKTYGG